MTAVETHTGPSPFHENKTESPTARFTAVNGREPLPSSATPMVNGHVKRGSEERSIVVNVNGRRGSEGAPHTQPRIATPAQEKLTITTSSGQREDWAKPSQPPSQPDPENSLKRKRSDSGSGERDRETAPPASSSVYHSHGLPASKPAQAPVVGRKSPDTPYPDEARDAAIKASQYVARDPYATPQSQAPSHYSHYTDEGRDTGSSTWYSQSQDGRTPSDTPHSAMPHHINPDDQLREALQRENQNDGSRPYSATNTSPTDDDNQNTTYQGSYGQHDRNSMQVMSRDDKKRKRNFSNRTKTGCLTCRKRKKKCDENRPECTNCVRGGFVCSGYPHRSQWPNTVEKQAPVPLQSKDGYDTGSNPHPQTQAYALPPPQKREPLPGYRGQHLRVDSQQPPMRLGMDDDRPSASTLPSASISSPDNRMSAFSTYSQSTAFPTPVSATPSAYPARDEPYKRIPPLHDPSRTEHDIETPQSAVSHISILHPSHSNSPLPHTPQSTAAQDAARLALNQVAANSRQHTQKEEMLLERHYYPFDRELVLDRDRCKNACWRFNSNINPMTGNNTPENNARLFREILQPKDAVGISPTVASQISPIGSVGDRTIVEAPFECDYGFNIKIGHDVGIGSHCKIMDSCEVRIGDRCRIGPNVGIYTTTLPIHPEKRLGINGPSIGKPITIEEDCFIGAGAMIMPGVTIRKGSTVGAGSVVTKNVPPFCIVAGNPAHVRRHVDGLRD